MQVCANLVQVLLLLLEFGRVAGVTRERSWEKGLSFRLHHDHEWMGAYEPAVHGYHARASACLTELVSLPCSGFLSSHLVQVMP